MNKKPLKLTALFLFFPSLAALAEQTVDIEIQGIRGFRAIRNTDLIFKPSKKKGAGILLRP